MATLRYRVLDLLDDHVATIVENVDGNSITVELERPIRAAFTIDDPDPDVQTVAQALIAFVSSCPAWRVEDEASRG